MMEREFISQRIKEYQIQEFIDHSLGNVGHSHTIMKKTPMGEKIIVFASRPGLVVGRKGANIKDLTKTLKKRFNLENPQIEISEVENIHMDANIVAEKIVSSLERFGTNRFKGVGHKMMEKVMEAGARGVEIIISGKVPGARARSWRFYMGYVKKCGDAARTALLTSTRAAQLKPGVVGIRVSIMPKNVRLPDDVRMRVLEPVVQPPTPVVEVKTEVPSQTEEKPAEKPKRRSRKKKEEKNEEIKEENKAEVTNEA
ncbi:MAG TPA: 30S ribosomal protein S3 [Candidatus Nanoarchaeia archaeon]|nr:30S ribosomal protein S3 [Candidatus Nanoarchaeia archaeon]